MEPTTIIEAMKELENLRHYRAVWMETVEHLARFMDKDTKKADQGISAEGCVENKVPQSVLQEFIDYINNESIKPLNVKIGAIEKLKVMETKDENTEKKKTRLAGSQNSTQTNTGTKASIPGKKIRVVAGAGGGET